MTLAVALVMTSLVAHVTKSTVAHVMTSAIGRVTTREKMIGKWRNTPTVQRRLRCATKQRHVIAIAAATSWKTSETSTGIDIATTGDRAAAATNATIVIVTTAAIAATTATVIAMIVRAPPIVIATTTVARPDEALSTASRISVARPVPSSTTSVRAAPAAAKSATGSETIEDVTTEHVTTAGSGGQIGTATTAAAAELETRKWIAIEARAIRSAVMTIDHVAIVAATGSMGAIDVSAATTTAAVLVDATAIVTGRDVIAAVSEIVTRRSMATKNRDVVTLTTIEAGEAVRKVMFMRLHLGF